MAAGITRALQGLPLAQNWQPISKNGNSEWKLVEKKGQPLHQHIPTGDFYPGKNNGVEETPWVAFGKAIGVLYCSPLYLGAKLVEKAVSFSHRCYQGYQTRNFNMSTFAVDELGGLQKENLLQKSKILVCFTIFAALYFDPMGLGTLAWWSAAVYALQNPLMFRRRLNQFEEWNTTGKETSQLLPLSQYFGMHKVQKQD